MNTKFKIGDTIKYNGDIYRINNICGTQVNNYMYEVKPIRVTDSSVTGIGSGAEDRMELYNDKDNVLDAAMKYCSGETVADARVRYAFIFGAKWRKERLIEKACDWLKDEFTYPTMTETEIDWYKEKIEEFKKAMEEEK